MNAYTALMLRPGGMSRFPMAFAPIFLS